VKTMKLKPETERTIWRGTDVKLTEGPHLYKINGYYYLFAAEGGTVYTHQEVVARSKSLDALSFEGMPSNPFITNFDTPRSYLQKQGHGALVDTPSGEWYYASLCGRPWHHDNESFTDPRGWCTLGRETSIQKVEWTEDGWPYIVGGHGGQRYVDAPKDAIETEAPADHSQHDDFMSDTLDLNWNTLRVPFDGEMGKVGGGVLELRGQGSLCNLFDLSLVARRWQAFNFDATVKVEFDPKNYRQMAGLTNYYDDLCWSWVFVTWDERRQCRVIEVAQNDFNNYTSFLRDTAPAVPDDVKSVWLRSLGEFDVCTAPNRTFSFRLELHRLHIEFGQCDAVEAMMVLTKIPSLLHQILAAIVVMEQACVEADTVHANRLAPRTMDTFGSDQIVRAILERTVHDLHVRVDQPEFAVRIGKIRSPDATG
jgi:xylan 1,4-beta-xylosidase